LSRQLFYHVTPGLETEIPFIVTNLLYKISKQYTQHLVPIVAWQWCV